MWFSQWLEEITSRVLRTSRASGQRALRCYNLIPLPSTPSQNNIIKSHYGFSITSHIYKILHPNSIKSSWSSLISNSNIIIASGSGANTLSSSYNGISWNGLGTTIFTISGNGIEWNGKIFVCSGSGSNNTLAYSTDGIIWTGIGSTIFSISGNNIGWVGNKFIAGGSGITNTLATSYDGISWIGLGTTLFTTAGYKASYNGKDKIGNIIIQKPFISVGSGSLHTISISYDGINWIGLGKTIFSGNGNNVYCSNNLCISTGNGINTVAYSYNGGT